jgi:hypothetical protein
VFAALRDTLARLAELADTDRTTGPEWALAAGQRIQNQLARLQQARSTARQVASLAPRRWPERSRVRRAGQQTAPLQLLAATVLSLAHASSARSAADQPHSPALRDALGELTSAFAALAEAGDANATQAALHATRARVLATGAARAGGPHSQLIARLIQTSADDTLRLTGKTGSKAPLPGNASHSAPQWWRPVLVSVHGGGGRGRLLDAIARV